METITINGKEVQIHHDDIFDFAIKFQDDVTGLVKCIRAEDIQIRPFDSYIRVKWVAYDVAPTGALINRSELVPVTTTNEDYIFFVQAFGQPIKKYCFNGLFRSSLGRFGLSSYAVYDATLSLIESQPVPYPEPDPIDDIDISDAFGE